MTTILVRAHKDPFRSATAEEVLAENLIGNNVGNLVFAESVFRLLTRSDQDVRPLSGGARSVDDSTADAIVLPLANAFRRSFLPSLNRLSGLIEKTSLPVTVLGVGAQARLGREDERDPEVDAATTRFVRAVLDHGPSIGVRGEYTRDYLRGLGFGDDVVEVIGCPSLFRHGPVLPELRLPDRIDRDTRLAFNASPYRKHIAPLSLQIAKQFPRALYFAQEIEALELLLEGNYPKPAIRWKGAPVTLTHPFVSSDRTRVCLDPTTWFAELAKREYSVGTRVHGNIAALLSGTPATVLVHDTRTRELVDLHHVPYVPLVEAREGGLSVADIHERSDWAPMVREHPANWERFATFLRRHGLRHVFEEGQSPDAFDARLAAVDFPKAVRTLRSRPLPEIYAWKQEAETPPWRRTVQRLRSRGR